MNGTDSMPPDQTGWATPPVLSAAGRAGPRKRKQTTSSRGQLSELERIFTALPYPDLGTHERLAQVSSCGGHVKWRPAGRLVTPASPHPSSTPSQVWFQNHLAWRTKNSTALRRRPTALRDRQPSPGSSIRKPTALPPLPCSWQAVAGPSQRLRREAGRGHLLDQPFGLLGDPSRTAHLSGAHLRARLQRGAGSQLPGALMPGRTAWGAPAWPAHTFPPIHPMLARHSPGGVGPCCRPQPKDPPPATASGPA
ncbi:homeobox protein SEBOX [Candoia aspera]|uniref:homeobox protein SEBOX n=1 Tax=Candoia aspera TaxID=51853 RepID=UPI002FD8189C